MGRFEKFFGKQVVRQRWWIISLTILILAVAGSGASKLTVSNDMRVFFSEENPQLQALEALENTYTKNQTVMFVIAAKDADVFTRETLGVVQELTESAWKIPYSGRVDSISNFQHTWSEEDDLIVEDLVPDVSWLSDEDLSRIKGVALEEPFLVDRLISSSGHVTGVSINVTLPGVSPTEASEVTAFSRGLRDELQRKYADLNIYLTGSVIFDFAMGEIAASDMATFVPVMILILLAIIAITLRSIAGTIGTLIVIIFSTITGMGLAGWLGIAITSASANAPIIIMTLAVADSIHLLVTIFQKMRAGENRHSAISESLRINFMPVFLTSVTTAVGFLTMNFSDAPPFRDLGNITAMGVMAAFLYSVFFLPAFMAVIPIRVNTGASDSNSSNCSRLADFVIAHSRAISWGTLATVAILAVGITRIELYDNWVEYFDERVEIRQATDFTTENLTGFDMIEYSLDSGEPGGISDPGYLATVESFANWYRTQPHVVHVHTIADTMKRLNKNMHGDDRSFYRIPEERDLAAQYLLLYEMSLPFGLDLNNEINLDKSATRVTVSLKDITTTELRAADVKAREWLAANAPGSMLTYGTGISIMWAHISQRNITSMLGGALLALGLISLTMVFALGSIRMGLLSLIPNFAPALMAFGVWGLVVGQVGLGLSIVISLTIGIVVDDTVHFLSKYTRARRELGLSPEGAVRYAFDTVGTAMWITTAALVAGFMVLSLSGFKMNSDMALMTAITITLALAMDFVYLPVLLMKVEGKEDEKAITDIDFALTPATPVSSRC